MPGRSPATVCVPPTFGRAPCRDQEVPCMQWFWLWLLGGGVLGAAWQGRTQEKPLPQVPVGDLESERRELEVQRAELEKQKLELAARLETLAQCTREQALSHLLQETRTRQQVELQRFGREDWEQLAATKIADAMQRIAVAQVSDHCVSTVALPSEEYKGRVIGKEGRNLRLFESLTGVDLLVDDTPGVIGLSCFDPLRREVARIALEHLVQDGRIQTSRIEEAVGRARNQIDKVILEKGRQAAQEAEVAGLHPELLKGLGRLSFRTSYRQNVLDHSLEVAWLCAQLASDLGADAEVARRAGLLHDIGKGMTGQQGPHALLGAELCRRWGESAAVCHGVEAHHEDVPQQTLQPTLVQVADAISASRPGARRENAQHYLQRLQSLEAIGLSLDGVVECQVVQAGREIRVFVRPESADDEKCMLLAQQLSQEIESNLETPGPIRVKVMRNFEVTVQVN